MNLLIHTLLYYLYQKNKNKKSLLRSIAVNSSDVPYPTSFKKIIEFYSWSKCLSVLNWVPVPVFYHRWPKVILSEPFLNRHLLGTADNLLVTIIAWVWCDWEPPVFWISCGCRRQMTESCLSLMGGKLLPSWSNYKKVFACLSCGLSHSDLLHLHK